MLPFPEPRLPHLLNGQMTLHPSKPMGDRADTAACGQQTWGRGGPGGAGMELEALYVLLEKNPEGQGVLLCLASFQNPQWPIVASISPTQLTGQEPVVSFPTRSQVEAGSGPPHHPRCSFLKERQVLG